MKTIMCSIFDKATEAYMRPFMAQSTGQAMRMFTDETLREGSDLAAHPEDYALFHIADFHDNNGLVEPREPQLLARAHEVIAHARNENKETH